MKVKFEVDIPHDGALLFEAIAECIRALEHVEDTGEVTVDFPPSKPAGFPGHGPGCRMSKTRAAGVACTCGPVPR